MKLSSIRILEGRNLLWDDISRAYKNKVDAEDYITMQTLDFEAINRLVSTRPFFSDQYVVELHVSKANTKLINTLIKWEKCEHISFLYVCSNKDDYEMLANVCKKSFNGYKISCRYWTAYVIDKLGYTPVCDMEAMYKTLNGRFELTDVFIDLLGKTNGMMNIRTLKSVIGKADKVSLDMIWFNILLCQQGHKGDVFRYLEEYRYGYNFIAQTLKDKYKVTMKIYDDFQKGNFNETNIREYKKETKTPEWLLRNYITVFKNISYDELLMVGEIIECSKVNSTLKMFELVGRLFDRRNVRLKVVK